jgi:predicted permease
MRMRLESILQDLRLAIRGLRHNPGFALMAIVPLAFGLAANTAIFSFVNAILLKQLPVPDPHLLVTIADYKDGKRVNTSFSYPFVRGLDTRQGPFENVLGRFPVRVNLTAAGVAEPIRGEVVTGGYFQTLQVQPARGRLLTEDDVETAAANPVCVISNSMWQERLAGDPQIVGRKLMLNNRPYTVLGVTQPGFYGSELQTRVDIQLPISRMGDFMGDFFASGPGVVMWKSPNFIWLQALARLKPNITAQQAQAMFQPLAREIKKQFADPHAPSSFSDQSTTMRLDDASQGFNSARYSFAQPLAVLMGIAGLILLIACANLAGLLLARASSRAREFAIRLSLGARRLRLIRQLMIESLFIAAGAGLLGVVFSFWIIRTLLAFLNSGQAQGKVLHVTPDPLVVAFSVALPVITAILFGLAPAWHSTRTALSPAAREGFLGGTAARERVAPRRLVITFQIALSCILLFAAGLLTRTLSRLQSIDLGFRPANIVALSADPRMSGYSKEKADLLSDRILERLRTQPGILAASLAVITPLEGGMISLSFEVPGHTPQSSDEQTKFDMISPGYFATLHQPLLLGRDFSARDEKNAPDVAIVNELFAAQYMPGQDPVGRRLQIGGGDVQIVGLVQTARYQTLREKPVPIVYLPLRQTQASGWTLLVRNALPATTAIATIERTIRAIDPKLPIYNVRTLQAQIDQGISSERALSFLSALFSGLATLLCGLGLYGIISYAVSRRTREIGVRFAIGAQRSDVVRLFLREATVLVAAGIVIGVPAALACTRVLKTLLYGLEPSDAPTLAVSTGVLAIACLLATMLPVRRAASIEPLEALRYE